MSQLPEDKKHPLFFRIKAVGADINYLLTSFREYGTAVRRPQRPTTLFKQVPAPRHHHPNSNNNSVLNQQHVGNPHHPTSTAPTNDNSQPPSRCPGPMPTPLSPCFSSPGSEVGEISESSNCSTSTTGKACHYYYRSLHQAEIQIIQRPRLDLTTSTPFTEAFHKAQCRLYLFSV